LDWQKNSDALNLIYELKKNKWTVSGKFDVLFDIIPKVNPA
jgi:hypothetical protein